MTVDKISGDAEEVQLNEVAKERDNTVEETIEMQISGDAKSLNIKMLLKKKYFHLSC